MGILGLFLVFAAALGTGKAPASLPRAEFHGLYALPAGGRIAVHNPYGNVRITVWDRDEVSVEAVKIAADASRLADVRVVVDRTAPGALSILTSYGGAEPEQPASVEYRITVPRRATLEEVSLLNGGLSISGVAGAVKASAVNGSIHAEGLTGPVELATVNGAVEADFAELGRLTPVSLSSINGPIRLGLPAGAGASLTARNLSGGIDSEFGRVTRAAGGHLLRTVVKGGGSPIVLQNTNGGISIHGTWSRRCEMPDV
jgi:hypothetical protein